MTKPKEIYPIKSPQANNFKSWKMRKKWKADFGKCFRHEWLVFVVQFENSLTPQRYAKENCAKKCFENKFVSNLKLWQFSLDSLILVSICFLCFPGHFVHFSLGICEWKSNETQKMVVLLKSGQKNMGQSGTFFLSVTDANRAIVNLQVY